MLGTTALRLAWSTGTPLVFTHHTMYEQYTHYVPGDSPAMYRFAIELSTACGNMCQRIIAPSESIRAILKTRGVTPPITVVPTGVETDRFAQGSGAGFRGVMGIPANALLVGHVGRLAPEKNLRFLGRAVIKFLATREEARFILVGEGPSSDELQEAFEGAGVADRVLWTGQLGGRFLVSAYRAMDVFAFASLSETQGMVLTEAMAAGVPVVAIDAPGVREVVESGRNGICLPEEDQVMFVGALREIADMPGGERERLSEGALATAREFSMKTTARQLIQVYEGLVGEVAGNSDDDQLSVWEQAGRFLAAEWKVLKGVAEAAGHAVTNPGSQE